LNRTQPAFGRAAFEVLQKNDSVLTGRYGNQETFFHLRRALV
jgi:hypothetical protein